jgi:ubiquinone/menaquinone biosynthesis C-methylase UbiE
MNTREPTKAYKGVAMEGIIANWYARTTLKDIKRHKGMAAQMAGKIPPGGDVLEIAPGPGYFCLELAKLGNFRLTGLDISRSFVEIARKNAAQAGVQADFRLGDAANMPFEPESFDFIFCQAAFKNFSRPVKAIVEMYRVLRPGGSAVISDMLHDAPEEEVEREIRGMGVGRVNAIFVRWTFKQMLLKSAYSTADMRGFVAQTPFKKFQIDVSGIGFQLWLQK